MGLYLPLLRVVPSWYYKFFGQYISGSHCPKNVEISTFLSVKYPHFTTLKNMYFSVLKKFGRFDKEKFLWSYRGTERDTDSLARGKKSCESEIRSLDMKKSDLTMIKELMELGFTNEQIVEMFKGEEPAEVAPAKATDEPPVKYLFKAKEDAEWVKDGKVFKTKFLSFDTSNTDARRDDLASAIWYVNNQLIKSVFKDDVTWDGKSKKAYVCKDEETAKKLYRFQLRNYITKDEWNAWCEWKSDNLMKEADRVEGLKVK